MKNPILGIENLLVGPLSKRISIFEKNLTMTSNFESWIFYAIFGKGLGKPKMQNFRSRIFELRVLRGRSNVGNRLV